MKVFRHYLAGQASPLKQAPENVCILLYTGPKGVDNERFMDI